LKEEEGKVEYIYKHIFLRKKERKEEKEM